MPSATRAVPISSRKLRARILKVGCSSTNLLTVPARKIMKPTAIMIAAIMTARWSARPMAVMTESSEKTMSKIMIWTMIVKKVTLAVPGLQVMFFLAFEAGIDLHGAFEDEEQAAGR